MFTLPECDYAKLSELEQILDGRKRVGLVHTALLANNVTEAEGFGEGQA